MASRALTLIAVAAAALALALWWSQARAQPRRVSGFVEAFETRVGSRIGGRVREVHVQEGQAIERGARLVTLEAFDLREQRAEAAALLEQRHASLALLRAGFRQEEIAEAAAVRGQLAAELAAKVHGPRPREIEMARARLSLDRAQLDLAQAEHTRVAALHEHAVASNETLDRAVRALKAAQAAVAVSEQALALLEEGTRSEEVDAAKARLQQAEQVLAKLENGARPEEVARAAAEVAAAEARVRTLDERLAETEVRAPTAGIVEAIELRPGDLVAANAPVLSLLDPTTLWVRAYVPETWLSLQPGDSVEVTVDAYPEHRFAAEVTFIARQAEFTPGNVQTVEERSKQVFRIKVTLRERLDLLRPGMAADVWFETPNAP